MAMQITIQISADDNGNYTSKEAAVLAALNGAAPAAAAELPKAGPIGFTATVPVPSAAPAAEAEEPEAEEAPAPRRKRRTKAQIAAEKKAAEEPTLQEELDQLDQEDTQAEPEATSDAEPDQDDAADTEPEGDAEGPTLADAVAKATELVAARQAPKVKAALAKVGVDRVGNLTPGQVAEFMFALEG